MIGRNKATEWLGIKGVEDFIMSEVSIEAATTEVIEMPDPVNPVLMEFQLTVIKKPFPEAD